MQDGFNVCKTWFKSWNAPLFNFMELYWTVPSKCVFFFPPSVARHVFLVLHLKEERIYNVCHRTLKALTWKVHKSKGWLIVDSSLQNACAQKSDLLVKQYDWHHGPQQQIRGSSSKPHFDLLLIFQSLYHCVSRLLIGSEQWWHFVWDYVTVYLMPYLFLSFWDVSGRMPNQHIVCLDSVLLYMSRSLQ